VRLRPRLGRSSSPASHTLPPVNLGSFGQPSGGSILQRAGRGIGGFLMGNGGENALNVAGLAAGAYGAYRQGKAEDREFEAQQEERERRNRMEDEDRHRRASGDPVRIALIQRLLAGHGQ
jgi:hypothetical protein